MQVFAGSTAEAVNLKHAILLYETIATVHDVELKGGKQPVIKPGELATKEGLISALRALLPETERGTGLLTENILATGVDHMVWWVKPATREVWFSCKDIGGERHAPVPNPGLVMVVCKSGWYVFAVKGKDRPTPETELFQVPYFNVWTGGRFAREPLARRKAPRRKSRRHGRTRFFSPSSPIRTFTLLKSSLPREVRSSSGRTCWMAVTNASRKGCWWQRNRRCSRCTRLWSWGAKSWTRETSHCRAPCRQSWCRSSAHSNLWQHRGIGSCVRKTESGSKRGGRAFMLVSRLPCRTALPCPTAR